MPVEREESFDADAAAALFYCVNTDSVHEVLRG